MRHAKKIYSIFIYILLELSQLKSILTFLVEVANVPNIYLMYTYILLIAKVDHVLRGKYSNVQMNIRYCDNKKMTCDNAMV